MNIHALYSRISPWFRRRRMALFFDQVKPQEGDRILDVGGYPQTWTPRPIAADRIDVLNIHPIPWNPPEGDEAVPIHMMIGDGCALEAGDDGYEIVFSNSVIEHVGTWENQQRFAAEARRVGARLWIQTPARGFLLEPHYLAPFIHWFPGSVQRRLLRWFTPWGWMTKPSSERIDEMIAEIRLLTFREMRELFPDCEILRERFLGIFTKSYIAFRPAPVRTGETNCETSRTGEVAARLEPASAGHSHAVTFPAQP